MMATTTGNVPAVLKPATIVKAKPKPPVKRSK
jgi:hypothetical protein